MIEIDILSLSLTREETTRPALLSKENSPLPSWEPIFTATLASAAGSSLTLVSRVISHERRPSDRGPAKV